MTFIVYFSLREFLPHILRKGSSVYCAAHALKEKLEGRVLLTSDAGESGGIIHTLQITITDASPNGLESATIAAGKLEAFFKGEQIKVILGVLLTAGLQDAVRYWGTVTAYSLAELDEVLKSEVKTLNE